MAEAKFLIGHEVRDQVTVLVGIHLIREVLHP